MRTTVSDGLLVGIRLALAAVFGAAALAKLRDREGTRTALSEFGVPQPLITSLALLLPVAELAVAASLVATPAVRVGAVGALALLALFSAAIAINLARGRTPDCHCFGQLHSTPIGGGTLVRNAVLGGLSALLLAAGPGTGLRSAFAWVGDLSAGGRAALVVGLLVGLAVIGQGWFILQLMRQQGRLLLRIEALEGSPGLGEGLEVGALAPEFALTSLSGETVTLGDLVAPGHALLALFVSPNCRPCNALLPDVRHWRREYATTMTIAILARGDEAENRVKMAKHGLDQVLLDTDGAVAQTYRALPTPSAVLISPEGRVRSPVAAGADSIRGLVVRVLDARGDAAGRRAQPPAASDGLGRISRDHDHLHQSVPGGSVDGRPV
jgi:methylamine dehydrogenase accessory protein MauD